jgi:CBS domain-containing protein
MPVTQEGRLLGMLWHRDLLEDWMSRLNHAPWRTVLEELRACPVRRVMRGDPEVVRVEDAVEEAARVMLRLDCGCLPAVRETEEGPRLIGIVTEKDLLRVAYVGAEKSLAKA